MVRFNAGLYDTIPQATAAGILALVRATLVAGEGLAHPAARTARRRLRETGEALRLAHAAVQAPPARVNTRAADLAMDRAWRSFERRLSCYLELPSYLATDQADAAELYEVLFPNGTGFLSLPYAQQWAEGEAILHRIVERQLEPAIARYIGAPFLAHLRECHAAYGEALHITRAKPEAVERDRVIEPLRETRAALTTYARVLAVAVENGGLDPKLAETALAPIAYLRAQLRAKKKGATVEILEEATSPEPLPVVE